MARCEFTFPMVNVCKFVGVSLAAAAARSTEQLLNFYHGWDVFLLVRLCVIFHWNKIECVKTIYSVG